jgi:hypothetical protein
MKTLLVAFCSIVFSAAAFGQNQTLMVNTNFTVVQTSNAPLIFQSPIGFGTNTSWQSQSRSNLGLGLGILTNTTVTNFRRDLGLASDTNVTFKAVTLDDSDTATLTNATNLALRIDSVEAGGFYAAYDGAYKWAFSIGSATNMADIVVLRKTSVQFQQPITFTGTNTQAVSQTRTNLGLGLPALTNTSNVTMMRALAGSTNTNQPFSGNIEYLNHSSNTWVMVVSNGVVISNYEQ